MCYIFLPITTQNNSEIWNVFLINKWISSFDMLNDNKILIELI